MPFRPGTGMYLKTPKRYAGRDSRQRLVHLRWLWLYILAPLVLIPAIIGWQYRATVSQSIGERVKVDELLRRLNPPTPTPSPTAIPNPAEELQKAYDAGRVSRAVIVLKNAAEAHPNEVRYFVQQAQLNTLRSHGTNKAMMAEALRAAQSAINANPEQPEGWLMTALALNWAGKSGQAVGYLLRARDLDEKNPLVSVILAQIYFDLKRSEQAVKLADSAIEAAKTTQPVNRLALILGHYIKAQIIEATNPDPTNLVIAEYERAWRALTTEPIDPAIPVGFVAANLAAYYRGTQRPEAAIKLLTEAQKRDQDDPQLPYWA
jgi:tetratricopeptide (TPR) repeat protein